MPDKRTLQRAKQDKREGKAASTQAGEFIKETMDEIREEGPFAAWIELAHVRRGLAAHAREEALD